MKAKQPVHCNTAHKRQSQHSAQPNFIEHTLGHHILNSNHLQQNFSKSSLGAICLQRTFMLTVSVKLIFPGSPRASMSVKPTTVLSLDSSSTSSKQHWNPLFLAAMTKRLSCFASHSLLWVFFPLAQLLDIRWFSPRPLVPWMHLNFQRRTEEVSGCVKSLQSYPPLCDPMDWSLPSFSVCGTL